MKLLFSILTLVFLSLFVMNTTEAAKSNFDRSKAKAEIEKPCAKKDKKCRKAKKEAKKKAKGKATDYNSSRSNRRGAMDQSDKVKDCMKNKKMNKADCIKKVKKK